MTNVKECSECHHNYIHASWCHNKSMELTDSK